MLDGNFYVVILHTSQRKNIMNQAEANTIVQALKVQHKYQAFKHVNIYGDWIVEVLDPVQSSLNDTEFVQRYIKSSSEATKFIIERS